MNALFERIQHHALTAPDAIALSSEQQKLSYQSLVDAVYKRVEQLKQQPQRIFLLQNPDPVAWVIEDLALMLANKVCIPVPPFFSQQQQAYLQKKVSDNKPLPSGTSKVTFTSGSTGEPKGVCLSVENQLNTVAALAERVAEVSVYRHMVIMPLSILLENIAGVYLALWLGAEVLLFKGETLGLKGSSSIHANTFFSALSHYQPDSLILTPALLNALVEGTKRRAIDAKQFKLLAVGGARLSSTLERQALALGLPVVQGYGLSEFSSVVALNAPAAVVPGTVGHPLNHAVVTIRDGGVVVRGNIMLGYWDSPDSWFPSEINTGDLGQFDEDGRLIILGRRKHIIVNAYGRNIDPEWLEAELCSQLSIHQAAVFGDEEIPLTALVVLTSPSTAEQVSSVIYQVNQQLPDYARIQRYVVLKEPFTVSNGLLTGTGRLRRLAIKDAYRVDIDPTTYSSANEVYDDVL
ncbi:AMP-binding protein [Idiomarina abyssalis]|uniref:AMP-binding protein n=1 Tax=Idiomarina abyssalis TaxID=86102 RepID=UPI003A8D1E55